MAEVLLLSCSTLTVVRVRKFFQGSDFLVAVQAQLYLLSKMEVRVGWVRNDIVTDTVLCTVKYFFLNFPTSLSGRVKSQLHFKNEGGEILHLVMWPDIPGWLEPPEPE